MSKLIVIVAVAAILLSACAKTAAPPPKSPAPASSPSQTSSPPASNSKIKTFNGRGKVTKIDLKLVSVELDHEEIKGAMPAMIMEFYVKEKSELEVLKLGDTVDFVLEDNAGQERIISIKKAS